jgi:hypothetical protein
LSGQEFLFASIASAWVHSHTYLKRRKRTLFLRRTLPAPETVSEEKESRKRKHTQWNAEENIKFFENGGEGRGKVLGRRHASRFINA